MASCLVHHSKFSPLVHFGSLIIIIRSQLYSKKCLLNKEGLIMMLFEIVWSTFPGNTVEEKSTKSGGAKESLFAFISVATPRLIH